MDVVAVAVLRMMRRRRGRDGDKSDGTRLVKPTLNSSLQLRDIHADKVGTSSRLLFSCFANISTVHQVVMQDHSANINAMISCWHQQIQFPDVNFV